MSRSNALRLALDLRNVPSLVRRVRSEPLPEDVLLLLQIAAGDPCAEQKAVALVDRPISEIKEASKFFIEQILFAPESNSYRVLGATPDSSTADLRRNMILLMRWLHPDAGEGGERHIFAGRVTSAWEDLKTPQRRAAYDSRIADSAKYSSKTRGSRSRSAASRHRKSPIKLSPIRVVKPRTIVPRRKPLGFVARILFLLSRRRWVRAE